MSITFDKTKKRWAKCSAFLVSVGALLAIFGFLTCAARTMSTGYIFLFLGFGLNLVAAFLLRGSPENKSATKQYLVNLVHVEKFMIIRISSIKLLHKNKKALATLWEEPLCFCTLVCNRRALLLDASLLTGEFTQIVQLGTTNLTTLVNLNALNVGRLVREYTFNTNCA